MPARKAPVRRCRGAPALTRARSPRDHATAMIQIERYLFRTAATASVSGARGLDRRRLGHPSAAADRPDHQQRPDHSALPDDDRTALPSLVAIIGPVALFAGILYTLNKLNGDSELVVMAASGVSPLRLLRPMALLSGLVFAVVAALYIQVLPWSFGAIETLTTFVHADFIANFARPGAFSQLENGFVFHFRDRTPDGAFTACSCKTCGIHPKSRPISPRREKQSIAMGRVPSVVERRPFAATIGWQFSDGDIRRLYDRLIAVHSRGHRRDQEAARTFNGATDGA